MKCIKGLLTFAIFASAGLGNFASAAETGSGPNPYSDCGIGAALFSETKWAAVTSNVIWDLGTTALTSATASPETCSGKSAKVAEFISHSYDNLVLETAKGEGEYLNAMLDIHECSVSAKSAAVESIRQQTKAILSDETYESQGKIEKFNNFYNAVENAVASQVGQCAA